MGSLTASYVDLVIDESLKGQEQKWQMDLKATGLLLRRSSSGAEWAALIKKADITTSLADGEQLSYQVPYFFGIGIYSLEHDSAEPCGLITFYMAYSTWDGRCLFIDRLDMPNPSDTNVEKAILRALANIAVRLKCGRLCWEKVDLPTWYTADPTPPELKHGWLTLCMDRNAMIRYTGLSEAASTNQLLTSEVVETSVNECLDRVNVTSTSFRFRLATNEDAEIIMRLVRGLAIYEKEPESVNVTAENYRCDSGYTEPLFFCVLLEDKESIKNAKPHCCGMVFLYFGYELGKGRFLYLEDLFLEEGYRKLGGGSLAMKTLAKMSLSLGCQNFYWVALDWNTPALNLYDKIGAKIQEGVLIARYTNDTLRAFAKS